MGNILIVEDEQDIVLMVRLGLRLSGHDCIHSETGEGGLDLLDTQPVDGILLDIRLPGMDGWEVLERIRARPALAHVKTVIMSAHTDSITIERARELGCIAYLTKPFTIAQLRSTVAEVFEV